LTSYSNEDESEWSTNPEDVHNEVGFAKVHSPVVMADQDGHYVLLDNSDLETALAGLLVP